MAQSVNVTPAKSVAVQLDEAAAAVPSFKVALDKAEDAVKTAAFEFEASKQKVRELHAKLMEQLGDIVPTASANFRP